MFALYIKGERIREYPKSKHKEAFRDLIKAQRFDHIGESANLYTIVDGKHILKCIYTYGAGDKEEIDILQERTTELLTKETK